MQAGYRDAPLATLHKVHFRAIRPWRRRRAYVVLNICPVSGEVRAQIPRLWCDRRLKYHFKLSSKYRLSLNFFCSPILAYQMIHEFSLSTAKLHINNLNQMNVTVPGSPKAQSELRKRIREIHNDDTLEPHEKARRVQVCYLVRAFILYLSHD